MRIRKISNNLQLKIGHSPVWGSDKEAINSCDEFLSSTKEYQLVKKNSSLWNHIEGSRETSQQNGYSANLILQTLQLTLNKMHADRICRPTESLQNAAADDYYGSNNSVDDSHSNIKFISQLQAI
jgi:hypothetical protein